MKYAYQVFYENMSCLGGLSLNETCEVNQQCTGTENANTCSRYRKSQPTCRCNHGYIEKQSRCYRSKTSQNISERYHETTSLSSNLLIINEVNYMLTPIQFSIYLLL